MNGICLSDNLKNLSQQALNLEDKIHQLVTAVDILLQDDEIKQRLSFQNLKQVRNNLAVCPLPLQIGTHVILKTSISEGLLPIQGSEALILQDCGETLVIALTSSTHDTSGAPLSFDPLTLWRFVVPSSLLEPTYKEKKHFCYDDNLKIDGLSVHLESFKWQFDYNGVKSRFIGIEPIV